MQCRRGEAAGACDPNPVKVTALGAVSIVSIDTTFRILTCASLQDGVLSLKEAPGSEETVSFFPYDQAPPDSRAPSFAACVFLERGESADARRYQGVRGGPRHFSALAPCCPLRC